MSVVVVPDEVEIVTELRGMLNVVVVGLSTPVPNE